MIDWSRALSVANARIDELAEAVAVRDAIEAAAAAEKVAAEAKARTEQLQREAADLADRVRQAEARIVVLGIEFDKELQAGRDAAEAQRKVIEQRLDVVKQDTAQQIAALEFELRDEQERADAAKAALAQDIAVLEARKEEAQRALDALKRA